MYFNQVLWSCMVTLYLTISAQISTYSESSFMGCSLRDASRLVGDRVGGLAYSDLAALPHQKILDFMQFFWKYGKIVRCPHPNHSRRILDLTLIGGHPTLEGPSGCVFIARKRNLGQHNVFTGAHLSTGGLGDFPTCITGLPLGGLSPRGLHGGG